MAARFFELYDDLYIRGRWHLKNPTDASGIALDDWSFRLGTPVHVEGRLKILLERPGTPLGFSETNSRIPVLHVKAASIFVELAPGDVQLIPVDIEGQPDQYVLMVATRLIRCVDETASRIRLWTHEDGVPHKVGQYRDVRDMRIDKAKVEQAEVFRPEGWPGTLIISERLKDALERMEVTGTKFEEV
jgi:hypothetical protein